MEKERYDSGSGSDVEVNMVGIDWTEFLLSVRKSRLV